jgi:hypothetical protein
MGASSFDESGNAMHTRISSGAVGIANRDDPGRDALFAGERLPTSTGCTDKLREKRSLQRGLFSINRAGRCPERINGVKL